jgi:hypothetical protein
MATVTCHGDPRVSTDGGRRGVPETARMHAASTTYRSGSRVIEVLAGESHSAAWAYITAGGTEPESYPCAARARGGQVRRGEHRSRRRQAHRRRALTLAP